MVHTEPSKRTVVHLSLQGSEDDFERFVSGVVNKIMQYFSFYVE